MYEFCQCNYFWRGCSIWTVWAPYGGNIWEFGAHIIIQTHWSERRSKTILNKTNKVKVHWIRITKSFFAIIVGSQSKKYRLYFINFQMLTLLDLRVCFWIRKRWIQWRNCSFYLGWLWSQRSLFGNIWQSGRNNTHFL